MTVKGLLYTGKLSWLEQKMVIYGETVMVAASFNPLYSELFMVKLLWFSKNTGF